MIPSPSAWGRRHPSSTNRLIAAGSVPARRAHGADGWCVHHRGWEKSRRRMCCRQVESAMVNDQFAATGDQGRLNLRCRSLRRRKPQVRHQRWHRRRWRLALPPRGQPHPLADGISAWPGIVAMRWSVAPAGRRSVHAFRLSKLAAVEVEAADCRRRWLGESARQAIIDGCTGQQDPPAPLVEVNKRCRSEVRGDWLSADDWARVRWVARQNTLCSTRWSEWTNIC